MLATKNRAERTATEAWDHLSAAMAAAGQSAREAGKQTADLATDLADRAGRRRSSSRKATRKLTGRAGRKSQQLARKGRDSADEAWSRANAAAAALAGRKPGRPWGLILGVALLGGVGFTVSLLIGELSYEGARLENVKVGVLAGSLVAAALASVVLRGRERVYRQR